MFQTGSQCSFYVLPCSTQYPYKMTDTIDPTKMSDAPSNLTESQVDMMLFEFNSNSEEETQIPEPYQISHQSNVLKRKHKKEKNRTNKSKNPTVRKGRKDATNVLYITTSQSEKDKVDISTEIPKCKRCNVNNPTHQSIRRGMPSCASCHAKMSTKRGQIIIHQHYHCDSETTFHTLTAQASKSLTASLKLTQDFASKISK